MASVSEAPPRVSFAPFLMVMPAAIFLMSWLSGGQPFLTDIGFVVLSVLCVLLLILEGRHLARHFNIGPIIVYAGTLIWYCHDYFSNWFQIDWSSPSIAVTQGVVAKAAFCTSLCILCMSIGLLIPLGKQVDRLVHLLPEPSDQGFLLIVCVLFLLGLIPYIFFTTDPLHVTIWKSMTAMRSHDGVNWTISRTGNLNYNMGAYWFRLLDAGRVGAVLASFYAIFIARNPIQRSVAWGIWTFCFLQAFGSGSRGQTMFFAVPLLIALFLKHQNLAKGKGLFALSFRFYIQVGVLLLIVLAMVQYQGSYRNVSTKERDITQVELFRSQGNHMFSEALYAYELVPDSIPHPANTFPGAGFLRPIPDTIIRFGIGWIPRAIWTSKPGFSEFSAFYNQLVSGGTAENTTGGTICLSIAGGAYVQYGFPGLIQMGILFGWLCNLNSHILRQSQSRYLRLLFSLGFSAWLFRSFRDLTPHDLYPLLIGTVTASLVIIITNQRKQIEGDTLE